MSALPEPIDVLPHRAPFLFLDRVLECGEDFVVAERTFGPEEPFFAGHFPGQPVVPGVILFEAMAQTLAYLALYHGLGEQVLLAGMDKCKVRRPVRPGETVRFEVRVDRRLMSMTFASATATVAGEKAASAKLKGYVGADQLL